MMVQRVTHTTHVGSGEPAKGRSRIVPVMRNEAVAFERVTGERLGGRGHMTMVTDWPSLAECRNGDPDALFVQGAEQNIAKRVCRGCPVRYECLADALDNRIEFGVWGGMTERERRALLRRHPHVSSWKRAFESAMEQQVGRERVGRELVSTG